MAISFVSLNIEERKHLDRIIPFLKERRVNLLCLQEVLEYDVPKIAAELGCQYLFAPINDLEKQRYVDTESGRKGNAILTTGQIIDEQIIYYGDFTVLQMSPSTPGMQMGEHCVLGLADCEIDGQIFTVGVTHFTLTKEAVVDTLQRQNLLRLLANLAHLPEIILAGDFNTPRGSEIFDTLAKHYTDNIPAHVTSTLDPQLHRAGPLPYVVDGLFTSPGYRATDVEIVTGLSDHCAIVAQLSAVAAS